MVHIIFSKHINNYTSKLYYTRNPALSLQLTKQLHATCALLIVASKCSNP